MCRVADGDNEIHLRDRSPVTGFDSSLSALSLSDIVRVSLRVFIMLTAG